MLISTSYGPFTRAQGTGYPRAVVREMRPTWVLEPGSSPTQWIQTVLAGREICVYPSFYCMVLQLDGARLENKLSNPAKRQCYTKARTRANHSARRIPDPSSGLSNWTARPPFAPVSQRSTEGLRSDARIYRRGLRLPERDCSSGICPVSSPSSSAVLAITRQGARRQSGHLFNTIPCSYRFLETWFSG